MASLKELRNRRKTVLATKKITSAMKIFPEPYLFEFGDPFRVSLQIGLHKPFESAAFIAFRESVFAILIEDVFKGHG